MLVESIGRQRRQSARDFGLKDGELFVVCSLFSVEAGVHLYSLDSESLLHVPVELFRVVDGRISRWWIFSHEYRHEAGVDWNSLFWSYPEFASSADYRERLFDRHPEALSQFEFQRERMMLEFSLPFVDDWARDIKDGWVLCASCSEAWQPEENADEMVRCPGCKKLQHKPQKGNGAPR